MNWTKVGLKVVNREFQTLNHGGLNWTKVGLKVVRVCMARGTGNV